jgi:hypothetical protein
MRRIRPSLGRNNVKIEKIQVNNENGGQKIKIFLTPIGTCSFESLILGQPPRMAMSDLD